MNKPCYHCHSHPARHGSNFCAECSAGSRPLFFPPGPRRNKALTGLLYTGAAVALVWLSIKTAELVLK